MSVEAESCPVSMSGFFFFFLLTEHHHEVTFTLWSFNGTRRQIKTDEESWHFYLLKLHRPCQDHCHGTICAYIIQILYEQIGQTKQASAAPSFIYYSDWSKNVKHFPPRWWMKHVRGLSVAFHNVVDLLFHVCPWVSGMSFPQNWPYAQIPTRPHAHQSGYQVIKPAHAGFKLNCAWLCVLSPVSLVWFVYF